MALLALVAFINHIAHSMEISKRSDLTPADHARVRAQYDKRFGD